MAQKEFSKALLQRNAQMLDELHTGIADVKCKQTSSALLSLLENEGNVQAARCSWVQSRVWGVSRQECGVCQLLNYCFFIPEPRLSMLLRGIGTGRLQPRFLPGRLALHRLSAGGTKKRLRPKPGKGFAASCWLPLLLVSPLQRFFAAAVAADGSPLASVSDFSSVSWNEPPLSCVGHASTTRAALLLSLSP